MGSGTLILFGERYEKPYYALCPPTLAPGFQKYVEQGQPTGDFLCSVLSNDLSEAVCRADPENLLLLRDICIFVHNELPSQCHGSRDIVRAWIKRHAETMRAIRLALSTKEEPQ